MDLLTRQYGNVSSEGDEGDDQRDASDDEPEMDLGSPPDSQLATVSAAPRVSSLAGADQRAESSFVRKLSTNPRYETLFAPEMGPQAPYNSVSHLVQRNVLTGFAEDVMLSDAVFEDQWRTFSKYGFAYDPETKLLTGDLHAAQSNMEHTSLSQRGRLSRRQRLKRMAEEPDFLSMLPPSVGISSSTSLSAAGAEDDETNSSSSTKKRKTEEEGEEGDVEDTEGQKKISKKDRLAAVTAKFHLSGSSLDPTAFDPPSHLRPRLAEKCFLPKQWCYTWNGHSKGVNAIRYFPTTGHMILSASMDSTIKLWDVYNRRSCLATYMSHRKPVRDICFSNDGRRFLSASYDKSCKLFDVETGAVIRSFGNDKLPYCAVLNPDDDKQNEFIAGYSDKKIYQWDARVPDVVLDYESHLAAVNTLTFVDENRRFVSSADDNTLRLWDYGIPITIKYLAEPWMHSMPSTRLHPNGRWLLCQSMDNQILVYDVKSFMRLSKKKVFTGHLVAGYACQMSFSNDGRYVLSGDCQGQVWMWEWKTCKKIKTMKCHDGVCIGCDWHPWESNKLVTCGWDGTIKMWD